MVFSEKIILAIKSIINWLKELVYTGRWKYLFGGLIIGIFITYFVLPKTQSPFFWMILGAFATLVAGIGWEFIKEWKKRLRARTRHGRLLGPIYNRGEKCVILITEYYRDMKDPSKSVLYNYDKTRSIVGTSRLMGTGDASALPYIYGLLMKADKSYEEISVVKSYINFGQDFSENVISIGGLTNKATKALMDQYKEKLEYFFSEGGNLMIRDYGSMKKYVMSDSDCDYGIIMKRTGLNREKKVLFVIAGIADLGTRGAAYYLLDHASELADEYNEKDFSLIIGVKREVGEKSTFRVDFDKISREYIKG